MRRTVSAVLLSILALSSILLLSFATPSVDARGSRGFSLKDIRGDYSVSFHGEITEGPVVGHAVASGPATPTGTAI